MQPSRIDEHWIWPGGGGVAVCASASGACRGASHQRMRRVALALSRLPLLSLLVSLPVSTLLGVRLLLRLHLDSCASQLERLVIVVGVARRIVHWSTLVLLLRRRSIIMG